MFIRTSFPYGLVSSYTVDSVVDCSVAEYRLHLDVHLSQKMPRGNVFFFFFSSSSRSVFLQTPLGADRDQTFQINLEGARKNEIGRKYQSDLSSVMSA